MDRRAPADHPIHDLIARRWSAYVFDERPVAPAVVASLLEAARWAPSSYNEQPWRFLVGLRGDAAWEAILESLVPPNRAWARAAPVLMVSVASTRYARNEKANAHAWHDVGLATANLLVEATARDLLVHPMGGFSADVIRERFAVPADHEPVAALAIGHHGDPSAADEAHAGYERRERIRKPLSQLAYGAAWEQAVDLG